MKKANNAERPGKPTVRCAIYTRKSTEEGLEQEFNSLDAQREAGEAYIASQAGEGWRPISLRSTTADSPAAISTGPPFSGSWPTSERARSIAWSSIRWIA